MDMGTHIETIILILSAVERLNGFKKLNIKDIDYLQFQYFQDVEDGSFREGQKGETSLQSLQDRLVDDGRI